MKGMLAALLAAAAFFLSIGLGTAWPLAWIAAVPVLWYAFGATRGRAAAAAAFAGYALGQANVLGAYWGELPGAVALLAVAVPALAFALAVGGGRIACRRFGAIAGAAAFAALWAGLDFAMSFDKAGGSVMTPAASQIDAPMLAQSASLVGYYGITFLLGAVSAALALALRLREARWAVVALCLFAANATFGAWRMAQTPAGSMRVALLASDDLAAPFKPASLDRSGRFLDDYAHAVDRLGSKHPALIVLPENIVSLAPEWRDAALAPLAEAAVRTGATVVVGLDTPVNGGRRNAALVLAPTGTAVAYAKRRLVPGLEAGVFVSGAAGLTTADGVGIAICKDMDFQGMIRRDAATNRPLMLAVPAWDFGADGWMHARVAMLRSIENGLPLARSARDGLLTLSDRNGRIIGLARSGDGVTSLVGDLPIDRHAASTLYSRLGDLFGYLCLLLGGGIVAAAAVLRPTRPSPR
jgi:apolipoprotein N-acyltransferase